MSHGRRIRRASLVRLLVQTFTLDPKGIELGYGARCTIGVTIPLVLSLALGYPLAGVSAAFGALSTGFASRQGVYRTRAAAMLVTSAAMTVSAYVGALTGATPEAAVACLTAWGFALGLAGALGKAATTVVLNAVVALIIFGHPPYGVQGALLQSLLVFAGGVFQTALLVLVWPLQRFRVERGVIAAAYRALADYASDVPGRQLGAPESAALIAARATLNDPQPFARRGELAAFDALLDEGSRIRGSLAALATDRRILGGESAETIRRFGASVHEVLSEIASAVDEGRVPAGLGTAWHEADLCATHLNEDAAQRVGGAQTIADARALLAQMRAAWRAAAAPAGRSAASPVRPNAPQPFALSAFGDGLRTLRANLSPRSLYAQHALRMAATLATAGIVEHLVPLQRAYWIPLTAVIVLQPEFAATVSRGLSRAAGTVLGALIAALLVTALPVTPHLYIALALFFAGVSYALLNVNYGFFSLAITCYVVFLLGFAGIGERGAAIDRVGDTLIGAALALAAYLVRPSWSRARVPYDLAALLDAQRSYAMLVLNGHLAPNAVDARALRAAQHAAWLARSTAEASIDAMFSEPVRPRRLSVRSALAITAATRRFGVAALTLYARIGRSPAQSHATLAELIVQLDNGLESVSAALRRGGTPGRLPALRATQALLKTALDESPDAELAALVAETDLMVESVEAMADALHRNVRGAGTQPHRMP